MIILEDVLKTILTWVEPIGKMQLEGLKSDGFTADTKGSAIDYVTQYDIESERALRTHIEACYPKHSILGEEEGTTDKQSDYQWVIDPIDGTTNYAHGFPFFCISIGLKYKGETILGVVYAPMLNYTFSAIKGNGAYLNGKPIKVSRTATLKRSLVGTGFPYSREIDNMNLSYFNKVINHISGIRRCGSAALDLCMVACGMTDAYWEFYLNEWDIIAGVLFVKEAGGQVEQIAIDNHIMLLSSNGHIHSELKKHLFSDK